MYEIYNFPFETQGWLFTPASLNRCSHAKGYSKRTALLDINYVNNPFEEHLFLGEAKMNVTALDTFGGRNPDVILCQSAQRNE